MFWHHIQGVTCFMARSMSDTGCCLVFQYWNNCHAATWAQTQLRPALKHMLFSNSADNWRHQWCACHLLFSYSNSWLLHWSGILLHDKWQEFLQQMSMPSLLWLQVWNIHSKKNERDLPGHADEVFSVDWSPDGASIASGGKDQVLKLWRH